MRFTCQAYLIQFDKQAYLNVLKEYMVEQTKEAAKLWLGTVLRIIPVWSEASHATFNELAEAVGFPLPLGRSVSPSDRRMLGFQTGHGGLDFAKKNHYYFYYISTLRYLAWNEYHRAVKGDGSGIFSRLKTPTPYHFQEAGESEFRSFAENVKLPNPMKYIKPQAI